MIAKRDYLERVEPDPTPDQIRKRTANIRQRWTPQQRLKRSNSSEKRWTPPICPTEGIPDLGQEQN